MGSKKKGGDTVDVPQVDPLKMIAAATKANRVNQVNPFGSSNYSTDANGNTTLSTEMSPEVKALFAEQLARAGSPQSTYTLPGQNADVLNGLTTRLNQRYGIPLPPPTQGSAPGAGGGGGPAPVIPSLPPPSAPQAPIAQAPATQAPRPVGAGGSTYSGGNGGVSACVVADSWLPYDTRADKAEVGDSFPVHLPEVGHHSWKVEHVGRPEHVHCVEMKTKRGAVLRCSLTTPFNLTSALADLEPEHTKLAPDMLGETVFVLTPAGVIEDEVISVSEIGKEWVQPLSFGGRSFPAGDTKSALIYSHNIMKAPDSFNFSGPAVIGDTWSTGSDAMSNWGGGGGYNSGGSGGGTDFGIPLPGSGTPTNFGIPMPGSGALPGFGGNGYASMGGGLSAGGRDYSPIGSSGFGLPGAIDTSSFNQPMLSPATIPGDAKPGFWQQAWDSKYLAPAATLLLGPAAGLAVKGAQKYTHRND